MLGEDDRMVPLAAHLLTHIFADALPLKITGDVEYLINRTANSWVVTLLNNNGVFKTQQGMAQVDRSAYVNVTISGKQIQRATEWTSDTPVKVENNQLTVKIAPGGVAIVEIF